MQGKLVFSQSPSTFLSTNRCSMMAFLVVRGNEGRQIQRLPSADLLAKREVCRCVASNIHGVGFVLGALMPRSHCVCAVGYVLNLVFAGLIGLREVGCGGNDDIARHLRVNVAKERYHAGVIELERLLLPLGPCT